MKLRSGDNKATQTPSRQGAQRTKGGRVTQPRGSRHSGRYTEPIPSTVRRSPRWYPYMLMVLLLASVITIILNYIDALPNSPSNWYTLGSIIAIVVAAVAATNYR